MRSLGIALLTLLIGSAAMAADSPKQTALPQQTDPFIIVTPRTTPRVDVEIGAAEIHTGAALIRVAYLPRLAPLPTTLPHSTAEMPNAFQLLGTSLPYRPGQRP
jgi:hypothetical protein